jgi:hypothetical protein
MLQTLGESAGSLDRVCHVQFPVQVKAVKTGSIFWSCMTALSYFYMVSVSAAHGAELGATKWPCRLKNRLFVLSYIGASAVVW